MKIVPLNKYPIRLDRLSKPAVVTPEDELEMHFVAIFCGRMKVGKSLAMVSKVRDLQAQGFCDKVILLSPTSKSVPNMKLFEGLAEEEDIYEDPTYDTLNKIKAKLVEWKDDFEKFIEKHKAWQAVQELKRKKNARIEDVSPEMLILAYQGGLFDGPEPEWEYRDRATGEPRMPLVIILIDDCQGSDIYRPSGRNPLMKMTMNHRHYGCGASYMFGLQSFSGHSCLPKVVRGVATHFMIWRCADEKRRKMMAEELSNECSQSEFLKALDIACADDRHAFLCVTLAPREKRLQFRRGFSDLIILDDDHSIQADKVRPDVGRDHKDK
jgi:hypothetical protein